MIKAIADLGKLPGTEVVAVSHLYRTPPWGDTDQDWFLNACVQITTTIVPLELLDQVKAIEKNLKRKKTRRWGPRTIDIDLLIYGDLRLNHERLELPHPRMLDRGFVMLPLSDIAADAKIEGKSVRELVSNTNQAEIELLENNTDWWLEISDN